MRYIQCPDKDTQTSGTHPFWISHLSTCFAPIRGSVGELAQSAARPRRTPSGALLFLTPCTFHQLPSWPLPTILFRWRYFISSFRVIYVNVWRLKSAEGAFQPIVPNGSTQDLWNITLLHEPCNTRTGEYYSMVDYNSIQYQQQQQQKQQQYVVVVVVAAVVIVIVVIVGLVVVTAAYYSSCNHKFILCPFLKVTYKSHC